MVVWGYNGITATAADPSPPGGVHRTVLYSNSIISTQAVADDTAAYNLDLLNRYKRELTVTAFGDPTLEARKVMPVNLTDASLNENMYIYGCNHIWNDGGYRVNMQLRGY